MSAEEYVKQGAFSNMTHPRFQREIIKLCKLNGWRYYFTKNSKGSAKGFPDLVMCKPPRLVHAELKTYAYDTLTKEQVDWAKDLQDCPGVEYYAWMPYDLASGLIAETLVGSKDMLTLVHR